MLTKISNDDGWKRELGVNNTPTSRAAPIPRVPVSSGNTHAKTSTNDRHVHPASREELGVHHAHARRPGEPRRRRRRRRRRRLEGVVKKRRRRRAGVRVEFAGRPARSPRRARRARAPPRPGSPAGTPEASAFPVSAPAPPATGAPARRGSRRGRAARRRRRGTPRSRFPRRSPRWPRRRPRGLLRHAAPRSFRVPPALRRFREMRRGETTRRGSIQTEPRVPRRRRVRPRLARANRARRRRFGGGRFGRRPPRRARVFCASEPRARWIATASTPRRTQTPSWTRRRSRRRPSRRKRVKRAKSPKTPRAARGARRAC